jgi:hypothetical protein
VLGHMAISLKCFIHSLWTLIIIIHRCWVLKIGRFCSIFFASSNSSSSLELTPADPSLSDVAPLLIMLVINNNA